jgi:hypothetical protein
MENRNNERICVEKPKQLHCDFQEKFGGMDSSDHQLDLRENFSLGSSIQKAFKAS